MVLLLNSTLEKDSGPRNVGSLKVFQRNAKHRITVQLSISGTWQPSREGPLPYPEESRHAARTASSSGGLKPDRVSGPMALSPLQGLSLRCAKDGSPDPEITLRRVVPLP